MIVTKHFSATRGLYARGIQEAQGYGLGIWVTGRGIQEAPKQRHTGGIYTRPRASRLVCGPLLHQLQVGAVQLLHRARVRTCTVLHRARVRCRWGPVLCCTGLV